MGSSHSYLQNLQADSQITMHGFDTGGNCFQFLVFTQYAAIARTQGYIDGDCASLGFNQEGSTYNHAGSYMGHAWNAVVTDYTKGGLQELYQSENLVHWVIENQCYQKAVPANIMAAVQTAPINGLAGGCVVGGYFQANGSVSAKVAT